MGSLSDYIGKAASGMAPIMEKNWQNQVDEKEAENLRQWKTGEGDKNRALKKEEMGATANYREQSLILEGQRDAATARHRGQILDQGDARQDLDYAKFEKEIQVIDSQIEQAELTLQDKKTVSTLRNDWADLDRKSETYDKDAANIMKALEVWGIKPSTGKISNITVKRPQNEIGFDMGEDIVQIDGQGVARMLDMDDLDGSKAEAARKAAAAANAGAAQPGSIGEAVQAFMEDNRGMSEAEARRKAKRLFPNLAP